MTGATSTIGGGAGAAARTLPLQPSAFSRSAALANPVDICFIISFPLNRGYQTPASIASLARLNRDAARLGGNVAQESSVDPATSVTRLHFKRVFPQKKVS